MLFPEGSAEEYLGSVRAAATRRTSEKLYKHLVKRGSGYEVSLEEELPGSRVLWGELLMAGFVEKGDSGGRDRELYQRFHDGCLHPMAQEGYLLTYAQPYNLPPTIAFQPLRSQGSSHSLAGASSVSPQGSTSPVSRSASREPSPTGVTSIIDVEAHLRMTIGQFHDNGEGSIQKTVEEPVCSENESKNTPHHNVRRRTHDTRTWSSNQEHFEGPSMYTKSHRRLLSAIGRSAAAVRMWDHRGLCDVEARNCSVLWSSRLAALFTALAALDDVDGGAWCEQCEGLLALLRTSFPWQLRYLLRCMKRYEDVEALYGSLVQGQAAFYQNGDALVGAYYGHMANGVGYASERQEQADANRLTQILAGWLTDARIHHFLEWFPHIRLHQLIFTAIMQLAPRSGAEPMDRGILELFSESAVSFMLNSAMHVRLHASGRALHVPTEPAAASPEVHGGGLRQGGLLDGLAGGRVDGGALQRRGGAVFGPRGALPLARLDELRGVVGGGAAHALPHGGVSDVPGGAESPAPVPALGGHPVPAQVPRAAVAVGAELLLQGPCDEPPGGPADERAGAMRGGGGAAAPGDGRDPADDDEPCHRGRDGQQGGNLREPRAADSLDRARGAPDCVHAAAHLVAQNHDQGAQPECAAHVGRAHDLLLGGAHDAGDMERAARPF
ncbi:pyridine nucleotide transhydrogenase, putative [Babesia caballi]|uniref:Pyridine nucleotide transhydrogenase, putative n=1 Tax=Babesia caballi TaxID=5871 RepID=A0AAV4LLQ6_BABCB|nr:pyridine nucleotide transhydrogenase, putative [Babesia caballi]